MMMVVGGVKSNALATSRPTGVVLGKKQFHASSGRPCFFFPQVLSFLVASTPLKTTKFQVPKMQVLKPHQAILGVCRFSLA